MSKQTKNDPKVQKPPTDFDEPQKVAADSSLSKAEKAEALDTLEQDARQLAEASSEGMTGGEPTKLHEVLVAEASLDLLRVADAYKLVLEDLRSRQKLDPATATQALLMQAVTALEALVGVSAQPSATGTGAKSKSTPEAR